MDILRLQQNNNRRLLNIIEKRIRKNLRSKDILQKNQTIYVADELTYFFLKRIITLPVNIVKLSHKEFQVKEYNYSIFSDKKIKVFAKKLKKNEVLFVPLIIDDYCALFLQMQFANKQLKKQDLQNLHSIFETITYEEIKIIIDKFKLNMQFNRKDNLYKFLDALEIKFPGTKHALYNSMIFYKNNL